MKCVSEGYSVETWNKGVQLGQIATLVELPYAAVNIGCVNLFSSKIHSLAVFSGRYGNQLLISLMV